MVTYKKISMFILLLAASVSLFAYTQFSRMAFTSPEVNPDSLSFFIMALSLNQENSPAANPYHKYLKTMFPPESTVSPIKDSILEPHARFNKPDFEPARFWRMTSAQKRIGLFLQNETLLKQIFQEEGVPEYLIWLAEVESAFDHAAVSRAGATGLYQLMPTTASRFGLELYPLDERKIPEKNARAAARYLKTLYRQFASWPLALAAYNAGEGCVARLSQAHNLTSFDELKPYLPPETSSYVPCVLAIISAREGDVQIK